MRGITIVGEQHETGRFEIESADGKEPTHVSGQQVEDGTTPFVVADRRHDPARFVQNPIARLFAEQSFAVQANIVDFGVGAVAENGDATVHRHALFDHEPFDLATRSKAGAGQEFLKSNQTGWTNEALARRRGRS